MIINISANRECVNKSCVNIENQETIENIHANEE